MPEIVNHITLHILYRNVLYICQTVSNLQQIWENSDWYHHLSLSWSANLIWRNILSSLLSASEMNCSPPSLTLYCYFIYHQQICVILHSSSPRLRNAPTGCRPPTLTGNFPSQLISLSAPHAHPPWSPSHPATSLASSIVSSSLIPYTNLSGRAHVYTSYSTPDQSQEK